MNHSHYSFFPGDYMRDTMHLGWLEDCAYRRLLDLYYSRGMPIRNDRAYIMRAIRANEPEQQVAVDVVLSEFFILQADGWHNAKADRELEHYQETTDKRKRAADARWKKNKEMAYANALQVQSICNAPTPTPTPTPTPKEVKEKSKEKTKPRPRTASPATFSLPSWVDSETWAGYLETRRAKRAPKTDLALRGIIADLEKLRDDGHEPNAVLMESIKRGWTGVFPLKQQSTTNGNPFL